MHWNVSKIAFIEDNSGVSISYTPWLRSLVPDISLAYLSGYYKIDKMSAVTGSLRYFSLGSIQFTNAFGQNTVSFTPNEFALDLGYARKLAKPPRRYELLGEISLLSPACLLSFERWPFHAEPVDHYALVSNLIDLSVSQSSTLMPLHSTHDYRPC